MFQPAAVMVNAGLIQLPWDWVGPRRTLAATVVGVDDVDVDPLAAVVVVDEDPPEPLCDALVVVVDPVEPVVGVDPVEPVVGVVDPVAPAAGGKRYPLVFPDDPEAGAVW
jgi:hypothetical protein